MSWSVTLIGKPGNIAKALEQESAKLTGQCKLEFDAAKPHLIRLVKENFHAGQSDGPIVRLNAYGSGYANGQEQVDRSCTVNIEALSGRMV